MLRSVRSRLLIGTILVSMVAILSVGVVTMFLVDADFARQEEAYLTGQASVLAPIILQAINSGNPVEFQLQMAMAG